MFGKSPDPHKKFSEVLNDVKKRSVSEKIIMAEPLYAKAWTDVNDVDLIIKQSFSLTMGCTRHLLYLIKHTGNYLNRHDVGMLNALIDEYKKTFIMLIWGILAKRQGCRMSYLNNALTHVDHLLYLISKKLMLKNIVNPSQSEDLAVIYPCPEDAISFIGNISEYDIKFLDKVISSTGTSKTYPTLFNHLLFQIMFHGVIEEDYFSGSRLRFLQLEYKKLLKENALRLYMDFSKSGESVSGESMFDCLNGCNEGLFKRIFNLKSDEYLIKIAAEYQKILILNENGTRKDNFITNNTVMKASDSI